MKARRLLPLALALAGTVPALALADEPPKFKVFGAAVWIAPLNEDEVTLGTVRDTIKASDDLGWNVGFEARFNKPLGLEIDYVNSTNDIKFGGRTVDNVHLQPLSATLDIHLIPSKRFDFYVGPTVSYFKVGDVDLGTGTTFKTDNDFVWGASVGLEFGGERFGVITGLRWLNADISPSGAPKISVDPLFSRAGLVFRF